MNHLGWVTIPPVSGPRKANTCPGQEYRNLIRMLCSIFFLQQVKLTKTNILPYKYITSNTDCDLLTVPKNSEDTIHQWKENLGSKDNNSGQNHVSKWKQQEITRIKDKGIVNSRNQRTEKSRTRTHLSRRSFLPKPVIKQANKEQLSKTHEKKLSRTQPNSTV